MFPPLFPIYIPALAPLHRGAPLVWLGGVLCLWLTRYTHPLGKRWGRGYYALSALLRPVGVLLIALGWLALYAPLPPGAHFFFGRPVGWLPRGGLADLPWWLAVGASFALGLWALATLGLRRSFLFRHAADGLVTRGPYALVRHPQFLSTIGVVFFGIRLFDPLAVGPDGYVFYATLNANWVLFTLALWLLAILEDRELAAHFGPEYQAYARRVPRLFPTYGQAWAALKRCPCWEESPLAARLARCARQLGRGCAPVWARLAWLAGPLGVVLIGVGCLTVPVAAYQLALRGGPSDLVAAADWIDVLCWLGMAAFAAFGAWALYTLGLRRSLSLRPLGDSPVTTGPYALVCHPQFLAAVGLALLATRPFDPMPFDVFLFGTYHHFGAHWIPFTLALWLLAALDDRALASRFGAQYEAYARRVPRLFPG